MVLRATWLLKWFWGKVCSFKFLCNIGHTKSLDWYQLGLLTYELLTGDTPYFGIDKQSINKNILSAKISIPKENMSKNAVDFILNLMNRNPSRRLGAERGASELKSHPWLSNIDWSKCA